MCANLRCIYGSFTNCNKEGGIQEEQVTASSCTAEFCTLYSQYCLLICLALASVLNQIRLYTSKVFTPVSSDLLIRGNPGLKQSMQNETSETSVVADCLVSLYLNINNDVCFLQYQENIRIASFMYTRKTQKYLVRLVIKLVPWIGFSSYLIDGSVMYQFLHL